MHIPTTGRAVEVEGNVGVGLEVGDASGAGLAEHDDPLAGFAAFVEKPDRRRLRRPAIHGGHPDDPVIAQPFENARTERRRSVDHVVISSLARVGWRHRSGRALPVARPEWSGTRHSTLAPARLCCSLLVERTEGTYETTRGCGSAPAS